uniref:Uncharacterized protein n=1 Tax=Cacopsylla melanoneura TaxID=428564 RepID=A0A8D8XF92_9HEMI
MKRTMMGHQLHQQNKGPVHLEQGITKPTLIIEMKTEITPIEVRTLTGPLNQLVIGKKEISTLLVTLTIEIRMHMMGERIIILHLSQTKIETPSIMIPEEDNKEEIISIILMGTKIKIQTQDSVRMILGKTIITLQIETDTSQDQITR